jgi:hypothetical protein
MVRIFALSCERIVPIGRESYNPIVATYVIGNEHEQYIFHLGYRIAKVDGRHKLAIFKALTEIMSFKKGNKFAPGALISTMLATYKD